MGKIGKLKKEGIKVLRRKYEMKGSNFIFSIKQFNLTSNNYLDGRICSELAKQGILERVNNNSPGAYRTLFRRR